jgi:hypothetical protein
LTAPGEAGENEGMNTTNALPFADVIPPELQADTLAVIEKLMTGKPIDPEAYRRIREQSEQATEELRRKHGVMEIAVDLIRATRDEE